MKKSVLIVFCLFIHPPLWAQNKKKPHPTPAKMTYKGWTAERWAKSLGECKNNRYRYYGLDRVNALKYFGPAATPALPYLLDILSLDTKNDRSNQQLVRAANEVIRRIGVERAFPMMIRRTKSKNWRERYHGVQLMWDWGRNSPEALKALIARVEDSEILVSQYAMRVLAALKGNATAAIPNLTAIVANHKKPPTLRASAVRALWRISNRDQEIIKATGRALWDPDQSVVAAAASCLSSAGFEARRLLPLLHKESKGSHSPSTLKNIKAAINNIQSKLKESRRFLF